MHLIFSHSSAALLFVFFCFFLFLFSPFSLLFFFFPPQILWHGLRHGSAGPGPAGGDRGADAEGVFGAGLPAECGGALAAGGCLAGRRGSAGKGSGFPRSAFWSWNPFVVGLKGEPGPFCFGSPKQETPICSKWSLWVDSNFTCLPMSWFKVN